MPPLVEVSCSVQRSISIEEERVPGYRPEFYYRPNQAP